MNATEILTSAFQNWYGAPQGWAPPALGADGDHYRLAFESVFGQDTVMAQNLVSEFACGLCFAAFHTSLSSMVYQIRSWMTEEQTTTQSLVAEFSLALLSPEQILEVMNASIGPGIIIPNQISLYDDYQWVLESFDGKVPDPNADWTWLNDWIAYAGSIAPQLTFPTYLAYTIPTTPLQTNGGLSIIYGYVGTHIDDLGYHDNVVQTHVDYSDLQVAKLPLETQSTITTTWQFTPEFLKLAKEYIQENEGRKEQLTNVEDLINVVDDQMYYNFGNGDYTVANHTLGWRK